jgi:hypothetical protein
MFDIFKLTLLFCKLFCDQPPKCINCCFPDLDSLQKMSLNKPTFTIASIVNESPTLQKLVNLVSML